MKWCETLLKEWAFNYLLDNINLKIIKIQMKHLESSLLQQISLSIKNAIRHEMDNVKGQPESLSDLLYWLWLTGRYLKHTSSSKAMYWIKTVTLKIHSIWLSLKLNYNEYLLIYFSHNYCKEWSSSFRDVSWKQ